MHRIPLQPFKEATGHQTDTDRHEGGFKSKDAFIKSPKVERIRENIVDVFSMSYWFLMTQKTH